MRTGSFQQVFGKINGTAVYLGTATSSGTAVSFTSGISVGDVLMLQAVSDVYVLPLASGDKVDGVAIPTVTSSNGVFLADTEKYMVTLPDRSAGDQTPSIQVISSSGTASVKIFKLV